MTTTVAPTATATGKVVQVLGNVVDVEFSAETLPSINFALTVQVGENKASSVPSSNGGGAATKVELGGTASSCSKYRTNSATTRSAASRWDRPTVSCAVRPW